MLNIYDNTADAFSKLQTNSLDTELSNLGQYFLCFILQMCFKHTVDYFIRLCREKVKSSHQVLHVQVHLNRSFIDIIVTFDCLIVICIRDIV